MAPLAPRSGHRLLRCPICRLDLRVAAGALACPNRHNFDLAREGYVNLLPGRRRRPANGGDRLEQLRHRAAFLEAGHFDFVAAAICSRLRQAAALPADRYWHILDAGCGTGHHPARIVAELGSSIVGLGLDIAGAAARRASRRWPGLAFAVADLWAEWPVHDAAVDLVISVFAPKNFGGDSAGPRPGGCVAVVYPGPNHLAELRQRYALMRHHQQKARHYAEAARRTIGPPTVMRLVRRALLDPAAVCDAVLMGPNARHIAPSVLDPETGPDCGHFRYRRPAGMQAGRSADRKSCSDP